MTVSQVFLTETRERFLKAVVAELPAERIRELYLFAPIRQGGVESGVAVIAAWPEGVELSTSGHTAATSGSESAGFGAEGSESTGFGAEGSESGFGAEGSESREAQSSGSESSEHLNPDATPDTLDLPTVDLAAVTGAQAEALACDVPPGEPVEGGVAPREAAERGEESDSEPAEDASYQNAADSDPNVSDPSDQIPADSDPEPGPTPEPRYTVYTARYRHTQKGPDRGKWESSVVAEADAPLLSIESVVRGVQRRSGDVDPPDHLSGDEVRSALRITPTTRDE